MLVATRGCHPLPPDAAHTAVIARNLVRGNGFTIDFIQYHVGGFDAITHVPEMHGVLQPVLLAGFFAVLGEERSLVRVPGMLYAALTAALAFVYARRLFGDAAGLVACALTLSSGLLWFWSLLGLDDAGFAFWCLLAIFALDVALERRSPRAYLLAGAAAAGALLQKHTGLILLAPLLAVFALGRDAPRRERLRCAALWLAPWSAVVALYFVRNWLASGTLMFRFGPIDWIFKAHGLEGFFAVYETPPTLIGVLASIGPAGVAGIVARQLAGFARAAFAPAPWLGGDAFSRITEPAFLAPLGFASLALVARAAPRFATLALLSTLASVGLVCGLWHFEPRFMSHLVPLLAIATGGALVLGARAARERWGRGAGAAAVASGIAVLALDAGLFARGAGWRGGVSQEPTDPCARSLEWIRRETPAGDRILTLNPWQTTWETERPSIVVPSGPREAVERVTERYEPAWLVVAPILGREASVETLRQMVSNPTERFAAEPAFSDGYCSVYRIGGAARPGASQRPRGSKYAF
jgi:hypothetical protein